MGIWSIITFKAFGLVGSSRAMPITTAFQLLGASLWGVFALGNWPGIANKMIGFVALIVILVGTHDSLVRESEQEYSQNLRKAVVLLLIGEIGYWVYSAAPQATDIGGLKAFLPQAIGMVIVAVIYALMNMNKGNAFKEAVSWKQIISGFFFAFAALTYLISAQQYEWTSYWFRSFSQTSVVLATLTGIFFLNQKKTPKELMITIIGLVLILIAASVTVFIK